MTKTCARSSKQYALSNAMEYWKTQREKTEDVYCSVTVWCSMYVALISTLQKTYQGHPHTAPTTPDTPCNKPRQHTILSTENTNST